MNNNISDNSKGAVLMLLSALSFSLMAASIRLAGDIPVFEKVFFRNLISLIIAFVAISRSGISLFGARRNQLPLIARSTFGVIGVILYFYSVDHLYLADSAMLNKLSPFFVTLFAYLFLKEQVKTTLVPSLVVIFLASMLIIKPQFNLSILPALAGFGSAVTAGAAYTMLRYLRDKEQPGTIVFYFSAFTVVTVLPLMLMDFQTPTLTQLVFLISTGIFAAGGQFGITFAYKYANASDVSIYNYTTIIFSALIGYMIWGEVSDVLSIVGGMIIIGVSVGFYLWNRGR